MNNNIIPVILSGGSGTRLWPLSRKSYPKQLLPLIGDNETMLQKTALRVMQFSSPVVVSNNDHRFMVAEQLAQIDVKSPDIILEPAGRNTAPAIALAAFSALQKADDAIMVVLPADHLIQNVDAFHKALDIAIASAQQDKLVTFGIVPTAAETGYGYIRANTSNDKAASIEQFVEKPDAATAQQYIDDGHYFWNSGMFVFKASVYLETLKTGNTQMHECCKKSWENAVTDLDFIRVEKESFEASPEDSIDYAVMEKTDNATMVPLNAGWSDLGSWSSLWEVMDKDKDGNVSVGDVVSMDCKNSYFQGDEHLIAAVGVEDLVVVDTTDALLIAKIDQVQDVKKIVEHIKSSDRSEHLIHRQVYRPWGSYEGIGEGQRYQVKRIIVKPGASLSLQLHHKRAEHWIVVVGQAEVQRDEEIINLKENESVYIPLGAKHRLTNTGEIPLELIEVQSGSYLGEDDIVRFEDNYGRSSSD